MAKRIPKDDLFADPQLAAYAALMAQRQLAILKARDGDPEDFIAFQWPHLVITDPAERKLFKRALRLDDFQWDIIQSVFDPSHTECYIKGCTKPGKGFSVALLVNIWFDIWDEARVILTGPSAQHAQDVMFAEVVALRNQMKMPHPARIMTTSIRAEENHTKHYLQIANPKSGEGFSGQHGPRTLFVFDESSACADELYENAKKQARFIVGLSNPRVLSGWFYDGYKLASDPDETQSVQTSFGNRRLVTVGGEQCMNVRHKRLDNKFAPKGGITIKGRTFQMGEYIPDEFYQEVKPLIPNQIDYARYQDIISHREEFHRDVFGHGKFPKEDAELQLFLNSWFQRHIEPDEGNAASLIYPEALGLDVAASSDGDSSALAVGGVKGCLKIHTRQKADVMETCGWVMDQATEYGLDLTSGKVPIAIDYGGGYGRGVGDRLKELGVCVIEVQPSKRSRHPNLYENTRAELYGELSRRLDPRGPWGVDPESETDEPWLLPNDSDLKAELVAQQKIRASDGIRFRLIPKDTIKAQLGRSPDKGDALTLLWRAVCALTETLDTSGRKLVHDLDDKQETSDNAKESPQEQFVRERQEHLERLCAAADRMSDGDGLWVN